MQPQELYAALEAIWQQCGYDKSEETDPVRDDLESLLEKVWFLCPQGEPK